MTRGKDRTPLWRRFLSPAFRALRHRWQAVPLVLFCFYLAGCATRLQPGEGMAATAHPLATQAALRAMDEGGNAFDAAIAAAAVLSVVEPYSAGLGGGGFWLLQKHSGHTLVIDARERAPLAATHDMYIDAHGNPDPNKSSRNGPLAAAIPGQPAAFAHINENFALRPLAANLRDAILLAQRGFRVDAVYRKMAAIRKDALLASPGSRQIFLDNDEIPGAGALIQQPMLADTLFTLARKGRAGFYEGAIAQNLVDEVNRAGGIWSEADLRDYRVIERQPIEFEYLGYRIWSAPPPSSGGLALLQMLRMLRHLPQTDLSAEHARLHVLSEIMAYAYRDRANWLGDPDFFPVPQQQLTDELYLRDQSLQIDPQKHTRVAQPASANTSQHTTHISILDKQGNRVSATFSINLPFGSGFTSATTGVLLNNEMDDFSMAPGHPNAYGLIGGKANAIAAGKRPLSSMTPTIAESDEKLIIIGTPGGSRIISMVFLGLLDAIDGKSAQEIVAAPRFHHQYLPDQIEYEPQAMDAQTAAHLERMGHTLKNTERRYGNMQLIIWDKKRRQLDGASDPRGIGQTLHR